jgi:hypothetical protein
MRNKKPELIKNIEGLNDEQQIQYWKDAYQKARSMYEDSAEAYVDQVDFYRNIIKNLRTQIKELQVKDDKERVV